MPIISFAILGTLVVGILTLWLASGVYLRIANRRKWKGVKRVAQVVFAGVNLLIASWIVLAGYGCYRENTPNLVYRDHFGKPPPDGTVFLRGKGGAFLDSASVDLVFRTTRANFDKTRPPELELATNADDLEKIISPPARWWRDPGTTTEVWTFSTRDNSGAAKPCPHGFYGESTVMTWDSDGLVQYWWEGID